MEERPNPPESYHTKPGDKILKVPRIKTIRITVPVIELKKPTELTLITLVYGFAAMIAVGAFLLMFPFSSNSGQWTHPLTCLFTSTSAVCVTGLVVVDTLDHWSLLGQIIIMLLIQFGGLGFMSTAIMLLVAAGQRIGLRQRLLITESLGISKIGSIVDITKYIVFFSVICEAVGAISFFFRFSEQYPLGTAIWKSVFQSVSAFNNAGFDLMGGFKSLTEYQNDYLVLITTAIMVILGGISFLTIFNIYRSRGIKKSHMDTKMVLLITAFLLALGTIVVLAAEYNNPQTLGNMPLPIKILNAFFQSVTSRTSGFNAINIGAMTVYSLFVVMILMFIGGVSGSTAGGIKVNTLGIIMATVWNTLKGRENPKAFGREFQIQQIFQALTLLVIAVFLVLIAFITLSITEPFASIRILFETISAFGTVGLSTGITPELTIAGRIIIIVVMFIGRLGPLTIALGLAKRSHTTMFRYPKEAVRIG